MTTNLDKEKEKLTHHGQKWVQTLSTSQQQKLVLLTLSNIKAHETIDIHKK